MYGQTEATARMATLAPDHALEHPGAIRRSWRGALAGPDRRTTPTSESLVYSGPNVMMGYAHTAADLAGELSELRTGDLARRTADGLFEVVGRRSRFAKVVGLRVDLDQVERDLERRGLSASARTRQRLAVVTPESLDAWASRGGPRPCYAPARCRRCSPRARAPGRRARRTTRPSRP